MAVLRIASCLSIAVLIAGCGGTRIEVRDQGTGVGVVQAQAVVIAAGGEQQIATADGGGRMAVTLPTAADQRDRQRRRATRQRGERIELGRKDEGAGGGGEREELATIGRTHAWILVLS